MTIDKTYQPAAVEGRIYAAWEATASRSRESAVPGDESLAAHADYQRSNAGHTSSNVNFVLAGRDLVWVRKFSG
jgi:hypothetical protein